MCGESASLPGTVSRRQLLQLTGGLGLAATLGACTIPQGPDMVSSPAPTSSMTPPPPNPVATATTATASPSAPTVPAEAAQQMVRLCRQAWGAAPARPGGRPHTITRMTLHHSEVVLGDNRRAPARLRQHQQYHQGHHGWIDIAYHVSVDRNGNIYELRTPDVAGDTATDYDPVGHFLVLCEGDFDQETVSEAQLDGAARVFAWAAQTFGITSDTLAAHRNFTSTTCPGADLYAHVASGELRRRIDAVLAAGPVELQELCGPEADATIARIELAQS